MTKLWHHQQVASDFVFPLDSGMLALEMGTGKTLVALDLIRRWGATRVLILCPKSVKAVWPAEFEKHVGEDWHVIVPDEGTVNDRCDTIEQETKRADQTSQNLAVVLNYEATIGGGRVSTRRGGCNRMEATLRKLPWDVLVMDESHRIKSPGGKTSRLVSRIASRIPHRLALTGTPLPHSPLDVYAQFRAIDRQVFGTSYVRFRSRFAVMGGFEGHEVLGFQNLEELHQRMYERTFRVRAEDVLDLPPFVDTTRQFELEPDVRKSYDEFSTTLIADIEKGVVNASNALVRLIRLAQITSGFYHDVETDKAISLGSNPKADLLREVMEEVCLPEGNYGTVEPIVVSCRFHHSLDVVHKVANDLELGSCELSGRTNDLELWQADAGRTNWPVIAVQLRAAGLGIDLTRARVQISYEIDFSLGDYEQIRARIHRPGQEFPVTYVHLLGANTVDETIMRALEKREEVVRYVVDTLRE